MRFAQGAANWMTIRILLLNYEYPPLGGGAGIASAALVDRLVDRRVHVDVVTANSGMRCDVEVEVPRPGLVMHWIRVDRSVHHAGMAGAVRYLVRAAPIVRRLVGTRRYDVVHVFFSLPTGALLPVTRLGSTPVVVSLRGSDVPGYDTSELALQRAHRLLSPLTRWIWRRADRVVAVCDALRQLARQLEPELRVNVIRNGVDLDLFRPPVPARSHDVQPIRCLAVSRLILRKGIVPLLHGWSLLQRRRFRLEIVGDGPLDGHARRLANDLGIADEVHFTGALSRSALAERFRKADLFTLVPFDEAFGNVYAEALASGLPIVGTNVGGIPELVAHGENGLLVPPGEPAATAAAIGHLADEPDLRRKLSVHNRTRAEAKLSWERMTADYLSLYHELADGKPRGKRAKPVLR